MAEAFLSTPKVQNETTDELKKQELFENSEKALDAAIDQLESFLINDKLETIKFSTNEHIRGKLHEVCDMFGDGLSHESTTEEASGIMVVTKVDFTVLPGEEAKLDGIDESLFTEETLDGSAKQVGSINDVEVDPNFIRFVADSVNVPEEIISKGADAVLEYLETSKILEVGDDDLPKATIKTIPVVENKPVVDKNREQLKNKLNKKLTKMETERVGQKLDENDESSGGYNHKKKVTVVKGKKMY